MYPYKKISPETPSAPFIEATVSTIIPESSPKKIEFIVDTGAYCTCLSSKVLNKLGSMPVDRVKIGSATGVEERPVHIVNLNFAERVFPNISIVELSDDPCLLGRDIINKFIFELNGPSECLKIL